MTVNRTSLTLTKHPITKVSQMSRDTPLLPLLGGITSINSFSLLEQSSLTRETDNTKYRSAGPRDIVWQLHQGGGGATKLEDGKVMGRVLSDRTGVHFHQYDENFKQINSGAVRSVKAGVEKLNG